MGLDSLIFRICDPFSGSSTTGIAANLLGREFVGIERESSFIDLSIKRKGELDSKRDGITARMSDLSVLGKFLNRM